jgi:hypothetical protein
MEEEQGPKRQEGGEGMRGKQKDEETESECRWSQIDTYPFRGHHERESPEESGCPLPASSWRPSVAAAAPCCHQQEP